MTDILIKRGNGYRAIHIGRTLCEHKGKDLGDASTGQRMPKIASKLPEASGEA